MFLGMQPLEYYSIKLKIHKKQVHRQAEEKN